MFDPFGALTNLPNVLSTSRAPAYLGIQLLVSCVLLTSCRVLKSDAFGYRCLFSRQSDTHHHPTLVDYGAGIWLR